MFHGMARGKVGDVVFSRLNGQQIARVRNRAPKNPRTNAQLYQRAIMATIMQAYSAGKEIFDHSFQGKTKGAACQQRFMSINIKNLRAMVANEVNNAVAVNQQFGRCVAPASLYPVPYEYVVSEGTYAQTAFNVSVKNSRLAVSLNLPAGTTPSTVAEYAAALGLVEGDYYTILGYEAGDEAVFSLEGATAEQATQYNGRFFFARLGVKEGVATNTATASTYADLFYVDSVQTNSSRNVLAKALTADITIIDFGSVDAGAIGVIRSRKDSDLRSSSSLLMSLESTLGDYGLASGYVLDAWKQGSVSVGDSDLILEGGNF